MNRWLLYPHLVLPPLGAPPPPVVNEEKDPDEGEEEDETPRMLYQGSAEQVLTKTRRRRTEARAAGISFSFIMLLLLLLRRWRHIFFFPATALKNTAGFFLACTFLSSFPLFFPWTL